MDASVYVLEGSSSDSAYAGVSSVEACTGFSTVQSAAVANGSP